ncbi:MAG: imidazole glycerol phosphate synthase subunit HisH [Betaproteobacteria bacterium]|jgi:glutamine amidotransferase|nr:imidazole glycerol phosphate synthase subunit HisH [Betaproteobacteria bacterium]MCC6249688.1 imidazole glycerol phosphate synthase subunit HisH [Rubrivivax sp.]MCL4697493.1 imidazole glycerol phosphate synthase subunit HisH [Burkholderiaceae bacterium]
MAATTQVTVVDYGIGNLYSVQRALESCGAEVRLATDAAGVRAAHHLVLPGVGAFADGMAGLRERGLAEAVREHARSGRPLLGICLGMQMLATQSEEFGTHAGLDIIAGRVVPIPRTSTAGQPQKVPYIGWTPIDIAPRAAGATGAAAAGERGSLAAHQPGDAVYLVHSFHFLPDDPAHLLATYDFGGHRVTAAVRRGNVTGFQFHPEKSGRVGLDILRAFVAHG